MPHAIGQHYLIGDPSHLVSFEADAARVIGGRTGPAGHLPYKPSALRRARQAGMGGHLCGLEYPRPIRLHDGVERKALPPSTTSKRRSPIPPLRSAAPPSGLHDIRRNGRGALFAARRAFCSRPAAPASVRRSRGALPAVRFKSGTKAAAQAECLIRGCPPVIGFPAFHWGELRDNPPQNDAGHGRRTFAGKGIDSPWQ